MRELRLREKSLKPCISHLGKAAVRTHCSLEQVGSSADCTECPGELSQGSPSFTVLSTCVSSTTGHNKALFKYISYSVFCVCVLATQSGPTLCYPLDCSLPDSSVHGILQRRILGWVVMSSSRGSSRPRGRTQVFPLLEDSLPSDWIIYFKSYFFRLIKNQVLQGL